MVKSSRPASTYSHGSILVVLAFALACEGPSSRVTEASGGAGSGGSGDDVLEPAQTPSTQEPSAQQPGAGGHATQEPDSQEPSLEEPEVQQPDPQQPTAQVIDPGEPVGPRVDTQALSVLNAKLDVMESWTTQDLLEAYPVTFETQLGFSPTAALNYDLISDSALGLTPADEAKFEANGFVIVTDPAYPTFSHAYHSIYAEDLPVYISADSVLDALHRSYDDILQELEQELLVPTLDRYLTGMLEALAAANVGADVRADAEFFLGVAQQLLTTDGEDVADWGGTTPFVDDGSEMSSFVGAALEAPADIREMELFGALRLVDLSQFKPRGHYTDTLELRRYFRAMIWLGRIDLRLIETLGSGEQVFHRRQVELATTLRALMTDELLEQWKIIDDVVTMFVGEHDYMTALDVDQLLSDLGVSGEPVAGLSGLSDDVIAQAIIDGQYGEQRIASHAIVKQDVFSDTLPLSASFALFGQRYAVDSEAFSQVVFDRARKRVVPDPLDAAFAALGNDHAASLLVDQLDADEYAPNLGAARSLVDEHPQSYWQSSLYTLWMSSLRTLSAHGGPANADEPGAPAVTRTEGWGRRLLNTQLGSWSQLRHDTILYVKQSYTGGATCEYPDAYVDPYPRFWRALQQLGESGATMLMALPNGSTVTKAQSYFTNFAEVVSRLADMADNQQTGSIHSEEQLAFINDAVRISDGGSGPPTIDGWYHQLIYNSYEFSDQDNIIADVHTDIGGDLPVARGPSVLHVGTANPRTVFVAVETCEGPRAYVGPVFNYKEHLATGLVRLTDEDWQAIVRQAEPKDVDWVTPILGNPVQ